MNYLNLYFKNEELQSKSLKLKLDDEAGSHYQILHCPICSHHMVHPVQVSVAPVFGNTEVLINGNGVVSKSSDLAKHSRGIGIQIDFTCEEGCEFSHTFQFHKGGTYVMSLPNTEPIETGVIWRD